MAVVSAIIALAEAVGLRVVAEGVENLRQLRELERLGCGFGQGYLWSRAVPGDDFIDLVEGGSVAAGGAPGEHGEGRSRLDPDDSLQIAFRSFAHEARNPLSIVLGWAEILRSDAHGEEEVIEVGDHIRRAGERIERLLANLDDIVALEEGRLRLDARPVDLRVLVAELLADMTASVDGPLVFDQTDLTPAVVHADAGRIEQVVVNLVSNAAKFSPARSPVEVVVGLHGTWADVSVLDQGPGIDAAEVALAFRKFGRLDRAVTGTGMGLYLARGIARAHGGEVGYRARSPEGGSIFTLRLPTSSPPRLAGGTPVVEE